MSIASVLRLVGTRRGDGCGLRKPENDEALFNASGELFFFVPPSSLRFNEKDGGLGMERVTALSGACWPSGNVDVSANTFLTASVFILMALFVNSSTEWVSDASALRLEMVARTVIREFPSNWGFKNIVSLESLYGLKFWFSESAATTFPSVDRLRLTDLTSSMFAEALLPFVSSMLRLKLSDPAKSTMQSRAYVVTLPSWHCRPDDVSVALSFLCIWISNMT
mmetsp:Transcript_42982/g.69739  ORF Transcript_42982/g.69739 Transcript_42982/m.69739 type:complete len:223 (-) Transcript_42982:664-1332(-)